MEFGEREEGAGILTRLRGRARRRSQNEDAIDDDSDTTIKSYCLPVSHNIEIIPNEISRPTLELGIKSTFDRINLSVHNCF